MPTITADISFTAALWIGVAAGALVIAIAVVSLIRRSLAGTLVFIAIIGIVASAAYAWIVYARDGERRALEGRLFALESATWMPGSPLSCLGAASSEAMEAACERAVFASPETVAAAAAFTFARVAFLREATAFARSRDPSFEDLLGGLRASLERDRYGLVAHVLKLRYGCTADRCEAARLLPDNSKVLANLREGAFELLLARHQASWRSGASEPAAAHTPSADAAPKAAPLPPGFTLPSAASIPPVSIMENETTPAAGPAPRAAAAPRPPAPERRPAVQNNSQTAGPPMELVPAGRRP